MVRPIRVFLKKNSNPTLSTTNAANTSSSRGTNSTPRMWNPFCTEKLGFGAIGGSTMQMSARDEQPPHNVEPVRRQKTRNRKNRVIPKPDERGRQENDAESTIRDEPAC